MPRYKYGKQANVKPYEGKTVFFLGDSITQNPESWTKYFVQVFRPAVHINFAVSGAKWVTEATTVLDGTTATPANNVIANQVYQVLNNQPATPDVIIIAAGTNDSTTTEEDIEPQFVVSGSYPSVNVINTRTWSGSIRWAVEKLLTKFPNAQIFISTPLQAVEAERPYASTKAKGDKIKEIGRRLAIPVVDTGSECVIYGGFEKNDKTNGKYLFDGLHLNIGGAKLVGKYIAKQVINRYVEF